jgi:hypothetical protein
MACQLKPLPGEFLATAAMRRDRLQHGRFFQHAAFGEPGHIQIARI